MTSPSTAEVLNDNGKRARQDESESTKVTGTVVASTEDEGNPEHETGDTALLLASPHSSAPEEDHELEQSSDLTTPKPTSGHIQPRHHNRQISDRLPPRHTSPERSLPPWKFISPRETNPAAGPPSAMSHRAHTPIPQTPPRREGTPLPNTTSMLVSHDQHGDTTYTSSSMEQLELNPSHPLDAEVLAYTDKLPMSGKYLFNANHKKIVREQVAMGTAYLQDDVLQASITHEIQKQGLRVPGQ
jgi:hypothetical protein